MPGSTFPEAAVTWPIDRSAVAQPLITIKVARDLAATLDGLFRTTFRDRGSLLGLLTRTRLSRADSETRGMHAAALLVGDRDNDGHGTADQNALAPLGRPGSGSP